MKKLSKILLGVLIALILVIDIVLTFYLLSYNEYNVATIKNKTFLVMKEDLEEYKKGDLLVIPKVDDKDIKTGNYIFYYNNVDLESLITYAKVEMVNYNEVTPNAFIINEVVERTDQEVEFSTVVAYEAIIGNTTDIKVYPKWGGIIATLTSRWVFLFVIILPILILFLYQVYLLSKELKKGRKK